MKKNIILFLTLYSFLFTFGQKKVFVMELSQEIDPMATYLVSMGLEQASKSNSTSFVLILDTYGGMVTEADSIRSLLLSAKFPVGVVIKNNAASAGAFISIACDSIYMMPGSTIGAASVVNQEGELMPQKYQSYMSTRMRATAELTGRNPEIAAGMVDENVEILGVKKKGEILTFTTKEAMKYGYCNAEVNSTNEAIQLFTQNEKIDVVNFKLNSTQKFLLFFLNPAVSSLLLFLIFGGLYLEFKMPGTLFPIIISIAAALLFFIPHYIEGLAANWEVALFIVGLILLMIEVFLIPGFGFTGLAGIILMFISLFLALLNNVHFDFSGVPFSKIAFSFTLVVVTMVLPLVALLLLGDRFFKSTLLKNVAVTANLESGNGFEKDAITENILGKEFIAETDFKPIGKISVHGKWQNAKSQIGYIQKGSRVIVVENKGQEITVREVK